MNGELIKYDDYTSMLMATEAELRSVQIETGADTSPSKSCAVNNIFDLAGNAGEWITEKKKDGSGYRASGGNFMNSTAYGVIDNNASFTICGTTGNISTSSRPILYK